MSDDPVPLTRGQNRIVITATTLVPLGLAVIVVVTALTLKTWIDTQFETMNTSIRELQYQMRRFEDALANGTQDSWHGISMELWAERLARANPTLQVPSVRDILKSESRR